MKESQWLAYGLVAKARESRGEKRQTEGALSPYIKRGRVLR